MKHALQLAAVALLGAPLPAMAQQPATGDLDFYGDFRLRYESIDAEGASGRDRARLRGRFGVDATLADDMTLVVRLATGDGSPVSRNLTLDSGFSAKEILVDRAYVDWRLSDAWKLHAGKIRLPWFRPGGTQLVWDNDLTPEGVAALFDQGGLFGSVTALAAEERAAGPETLLLTLQGGYRAGLPGDSSLTAGLGYYAYTDMAGQQPLYDGDPRGNSVDLAGAYLNDYRLLEGFVEYSTRLRDLPVTLYADLVHNTAADAEADAYAIGANFGKLDGARSWQLGYAWQDSEADAVVAVFTDSNFAGGESDSRGHVIRGKYALRDNVTLGGTVVVSERGRAAAGGLDFDRLILDIEFSFD